MSAAGLVDVLDVQIRPGGDADMGYVIDSWGRSLRTEYPDARTGDFVDALRRGIGRRVREGAILFVAYPAAEPELTLGWAMVTPMSCVHYVYVRHAYRRLGIARALMAAIFDLRDVLTCTSLTDDARAIRRKHRDRIRYRPTI